MQDTIILVLLLFGILYQKYHFWIQEHLNNPFFLVLIGCLGVSAFFIGHYMEKLMNRINMWRQGVRRDQKENEISFPFVPFDLQKQLDEFYELKENNEFTFLGINAEKQNKEIIS